MKCSVIMTTYNGEKYVIQQLDSIRLQSKKADEVLIFDDCSSDDTIKIIKEYIDEYHLENWKLTVNAFNKGWQRNFMDGISEAKGDIVFLADQDDIWHPEKIRIMHYVMESNQEIGVLVCGYVKFTSNERIRFKDVDKILYHKLPSSSNNITGNFPGCTYCINNCFFSNVKNNWVKLYPHDRFIYICGWAYGNLYKCENVLHYFRRHNESVTTISPPVFNKAKRYSFLLKELEICKNITNSNNYQCCAEMYHYISWISLRCNFLLKFSLLATFKLLKYRRFYPRLLTYFNDIFVSIGKNSEI